MMLANQQAEIVSRILSTCCDKVEPAGPWSWNCVVQNGTRLPIAAKFEEGFLHLATGPTETENTACTLEDALLGNSSLAGGVKAALPGPSTLLRLQTDIAVLDEKQLTDRFWWAVNGFHDGSLMLRSPASPVNCQLSENCDEGDALRELLRESSWTSTVRGSNDLSVEIDRDSSARARIRMTKTGVVSSVELLRTNAIAETNRRALALFLLRATGALRFVRAHAQESSGEWSFGMQVSLPLAAPGEIDHALAALATAHRMYARETTVLLDDTAARWYLAACETSTTNDQQPKEI
jgi:hypothetical protein